MTPFFIPVALAFVFLAVVVFMVNRERPTFFPAVLSAIADKLRGGSWLTISLVLITALYFFAPHQLGVLLWAVVKLTVAAYAGYWVDRLAFKDARPHLFNPANDGDESLWVFAWLRRAMIISATLIAVALTA